MIKIQGCFSLKCSVFLHIDILKDDTCGFLPQLFLLSFFAKLTVIYYYAYILSLFLDHIFFYTFHIHPFSLPCNCMFLDTFISISVKYEDPQAADGLAGALDTRQQNTGAVCNNSKHLCKRM